MEEEEEEKMNAERRIEEEEEEKMKAERRKGGGGGEKMEFERRKERTHRQNSGLHSTGISELCTHCTAHVHALLSNNPLQS